MDGEIKRDSIKQEGIESQNLIHQKLSQKDNKILKQEQLTPSTIDRSINLQMFHFLPDFVQPIDENNYIELQSLNISTLTKFKLEVIVDFLSKRDNQIQILTEINIDQEKFNSLKNIIKAETFYHVETKRFNHINGGILALWSKSLKIKPSHSLRNFNDFRILFLEFKVNLDLTILLVACYLPTVDLFEWQNIGNLNPDINQQEISAHTDRKEYAYYYNHLKEILDPNNSNYDKIILIGDFNLHYISLSENEQMKQVVQKQLFDNFIQPNRLSINEFDENNEFDYTYFKGEKMSIVDYCFNSSNIGNYLSKTKIFNDPLIQTDHNTIYVKISINSINKINKPNINKTIYVNSSQLATDEGINSYVSALGQVDISNINLKDQLKIIKEPLMQKSKKNNIFQIDDKVTKTLKKIKNYFMTNKRFTLASLTTKRLRKQVSAQRRIKSQKRTNEIISKRDKNLRDWWKLITRYVKPRKNTINLNVNEEGQSDVNTTLKEFQKFFKELQQRKVYSLELESLEDWIALFFVKQYPIGVFEIYSRFIEHHIQRGTLITRPLLEIFIGVQNELSERDWSFSDIVNSKQDSIGGIQGDYQKPQNGRKVSSEEITGYLKQMKNHKAPGFDSVDSQILKNLPPNQIDKLAEFQNKILDHSQLDDDLKQVIIALLSKNDNANPTPDDFRPISLLSVPCFKLIEKVIMERMLLSTNIFQFGFKKHNSTSDMIKVLQEILDNCKRKYDNGVGTFVLGMYDFKKAFNSVFFLKLIAKLDTRGVDKSLLALLLNLYMPQKVYFRIGDNLTQEAISLNVYCGHQGSCFMPQGFAEYISDFIDEIERRESNMIQVNVNGIDQYSNEVMFADDQNEANQFRKYSRNQEISFKLQTNLDYFKSQAELQHLKVADPKCKHLTNDVSKIRLAIQNWNEYDVCDSAKLVGLRFKIKSNLDLCQDDQFKQAQDKCDQTFIKLKMAYGRNKFLSAKQCVNLTKCFCIPIVDQCNVVTNFKEIQIIKLDSLIFKSVKHILGFRYTTLSLNFQLCFNLMGYKYRQKVAKLTFILKHLDSNFQDLNACSKLLQSNQTDLEKNEMVWECLGDLDLTGLKEWMIEKRLILREQDFDQSQMTLLQFVHQLQVNSKPNIHRHHIHSSIKHWVKCLMKLRLVVAQLDFQGPYTKSEMELCLGFWRINTMHVNYQDGADLLKNHTAWFVLKYFDLDSRQNCTELNNADRTLDKRYLKLFFCGQRLNYRIRIFTQSERNNQQITDGLCLMCNENCYEDEEHVLRYCTAYDDLRNKSFNTILPLSNFRISQNDFHRITELQVFGSQEMLNRLFGVERNENENIEGIEYSLKAHRSFNLEMKSMVKAMLDRRKDKMISIPIEERADIYPEFIPIQKQFMQLYQWKF